MFDDSGISITSTTLLVMALIALGVASYIKFVVYGYPIAIVNLGGAVGGALALVILPILVIVPWRFVQRRREKITNVPLFVGTMVFIAMIALSINGALYTVSQVR
jgi:hypothetical protein